mgnify:CR=1 FL=1
MNTVILNYAARGIRVEPDRLLEIEVDVYTRVHDIADPQIEHLGHNARVIHIPAGPAEASKQQVPDHLGTFQDGLMEFQQTHGLTYDLIHSHYWLSGRVGMVLSREWGVPHVATFHTLARTKLRARAGENETELRLAVEKRVMDSADAVVVSTALEKEDLVQLYQARPHNVHVIPAGVDLEMFRPMDQTRARQALGLSETRVILYVGRLEPLKGVDLLINAVPLLGDLGDTRLMVVGGQPGKDKELRRLKVLTSRLGIQKRVTFTGAVKQAELPNYYNAADVFVLPSYYESFGLVALEAMACGTPVVVSRVGGLKTFVRDGETGYLIPWRTPEPFAQRMDVLLANPALRKTMGKAARAKAQEMSWSVVADRMSDYYSCLMGEMLESVAGA